MYGAVAYLWHVSLSPSHTFMDTRRQQKHWQQSVRRQAASVCQAHFAMSTARAPRFVDAFLMPAAAAARDSAADLGLFGNLCVYVSYVNKNERLV